MIILIFSTCNLIKKLKSFNRKVRQDLKPKVAKDFLIPSLARICNSCLLHFNQTRITMRQLRKILHWFNYPFLIPPGRGKNSQEEDDFSPPLGEMPSLRGRGGSPGKFFTSQEGKMIFQSPLSGI
jgi:hypothetical protein